jgi:hypothetical protein
VDMSSDLTGTSNMDVFRGQPGTPVKTHDRSTGHTCQDP